jgi:hypothetical protein
MQSAETVLGVLRERDGRGLPCEELYRQMFNPRLYLLAYGRIYPNKGAMTAGVTPETVNGMSLGRSAGSSRRCASSGASSTRCGGRTFPNETGRRGSWACRPGRTSWSVRSCACCWRRTTAPVLRPLPRVPARARPPHRAAGGGQHLERNELVHRG